MEVTEFQGVCGQSLGSSCLGMVWEEGRGEGKDEEGGVGSSGVGWGWRWGAWEEATHDGDRILWEEET